MSKQTLDGTISEMQGENKCVSRPPANYPNPTPADIDSPEFNAVWEVIKDWDINVPDWYDGYTGAMGNHVMAILNALKTVQL